MGIDSTCPVWCGYILIIVQIRKKKKEKFSWYPNTIFILVMEDVHPLPPYCRIKSSFWRHTQINTNKKHIYYFFFSKEHHSFQSSQNSPTTSTISSREETGSELRIHDVTAIFNADVFHAGRSLDGVCMVRDWVYGK